MLLCAVTDRTLRRLSLARSRLCANALAAMAGARAPWDSAARDIATIDGPDPRNQSGAESIRMIEAEEQLSPDPAAANPSIMAQALAALAATRWPLEPGKAADAYEQALSLFRLKGTRIRSSPAMLYRYVNGPSFLRILARALADAGQDRLANGLDRLIRAASGKPPTATWEAVVAYIQKAGVWTLLISQPIQLARPGRSMFVTFDGAPPAGRRSARWLHAALALWLDRDPCFLELRFPARGGDRLLFPTFADAGWFRHFHGAPVGEPHGWTRPHPPLDPVADRQPEAVSEPCMLDRLDSPQHLRALPPGG